MNVPDVYTRAQQLGFKYTMNKLTDQLCKWLRDEHSLLIVVDMSGTGMYEFHITFMDNPSTSYGTGEEFHAYEEALESAMNTAMDFII